MRTSWAIRSTRRLTYEDVDACVSKVLLTMETLGWIPKAEGGGKTYSDEDQKKVEERLRGLGYIE